MRSFKQFTTLSLTLALSLGFSACGGGGGGDTSSSSNNNEGGTSPTSNTNTSSGTVTSNKTTFSGVAVDGYISGGTACLDTNINGLCDSGEPTTPTDTQGKFTFTDVEVDSGKLISVIVSGGTDTATNKPFQGSMSNIINTDDIATNKSFTTSPLTDLVATSFLASNNKSSASLAQIKTNVASSLNLSVDKLDKDPMQDKEVFAKAQEVQQTKKLILTAATKAANGSLNAEELTKSVREAISTSVQSGTTLNSTNVITKLKEIHTTVDIPSNETDFIASQTTEIKNTLATIVADTTITADTLDQQESNLITAVETASAKIEDATDGSVITVVKVAPINPATTQTPTTPIATAISTPPAVPAL